MDEDSKAAKVFKAATAAERAEALWEEVAREVAETYPVDSCAALEKVLKPMAKNLKSSDKLYGLLLEEYCEGEDLNTIFLREGGRLNDPKGLRRELDLVNRALKLGPSQLLQTIKEELQGRLQTLK